MRVEQLMTREVRCCRAGDNLDAAARIMWERDCGCVPVVDERNTVVGILTDRDACMAAHTKGARLSDVRVEDVMAKQVITCGARDTIAAVEALMRRHQLRRLPVVGADGRLVGILSLNDLARAALRGDGDLGLSPEAVEETLAAVCQPRRQASA